MKIRIISLFPILVFKLKENSSQKKRIWLAMPLVNFEKCIVLLL